MTDNEPALSSEFSVCQFFRNGSYEYVRRWVTAKAAVDAAYHYTHSVGATMGTTQRVIITDGGDSCVFEWQFGKGVVFPEELAIRQSGLRDYHKK